MPDCRAAVASSGSGRRPQIVTVAPACASATAIAAPMPLPPPVMSACWPASAMSHRRRCNRLGAAAEPIKLIAPGVIRRRPGLAAVAELGGGMERPIWVGKMRPSEADQIGASGHQDRVDVVRLENVANRHGGHAGLVADAVGERRLKHAAVD